LCAIRTHDGMWHRVGTVVTQGFHRHWAQYSPVKIAELNDPATLRLTS
jgi:hypothetical protein